MGWTGHQITFRNTTEKKEYLKDLFTWEEENGTIGYEAVDISLVGSTAYLAVRNLSTGAIRAVVVLTSTENGWFYEKSMGDDVHPYYFDCPKRILNRLTPTDSELANAWRNECQKKHRIPPLKNGDKFQLTEPVKFKNGKLLSKFEKITVPGRRNVCRSLEDGGLYRLSVKNYEYEIITG